MKEFNISGTCIPSKYYMANISDKLNKIINMIGKDDLSEENKAFDCLSEKILLKF